MAGCRRSGKGSRPFAIVGNRLHANTLPILIAIIAVAIGTYAADLFDRTALFVQPSALTKEDTAPDMYRASFSLCGSAKRINCVVDGDTFWMNGEKIRIADIDTPELSPPRCAREKALGLQAKQELQNLLNAGSFELAGWGSSDRDRYGRKLRTVTRNGQSIGKALIAKGLARPWEGSRRSWCG